MTLLSAFASSVHGAPPVIRCGTPAPSQDQAASVRMKTKNFNAQFEKSQLAFPDMIIINVVFHVLYTEGYGIVSDQQIDDQLTVLKKFTCQSD
jgi:hypothetical protein